jgi:hypothetical protein
MSDSENQTPGESAKGASGEQEKTQPKDFWDKTATISGVLSSVLIASFGLYFNHTTGESQQKLDELLGQQQHEIAVRENRLRELEVVESLLPHLASTDTTEDRKKLALLALRRLGNEGLATEFAEVLGGKGAEAALSHIAKTANSQEQREQARAALTRLTLGATGRDVANPDLDAVIAGLESLKGKTDHFAILERGKQTYMQTMGGPEEFVLEYRDGSADRHFRCKATKQVVIAAFRSYATPGDEAWRKACQWERARF